MGSDQRPTEIHILALPLPFQGHLNPMLQFSNRLVSKGIKVTLLAFTSKEMIKCENSSINVEFISDNDDTVEEDNNFQKLPDTVSRRLPEIVAKLRESGNPVSCLVYDSLMHWVLDIAKKLELLGAALFTMSCAVSNIFCKAHEGKLNVPIEHTPVSLDGMPPLDIFDLPTFFFDLDYYPTALQFLRNQFLNVALADCVFFNTFSTLEDEVLSWMESQCTAKAVGPTIPSKYLDRRIENNKDYGLSLFKPDIENCMKWLDSRETGSVVYVSYGSLSVLSDKQMEEIACGLKSSNHYFLWVVRESEKERLPSNFVETSDKGLVVNWCHQLEVLAHKSVGCFVTHCGWNSTMEALSLGVPMVAMPQWADQTTNAKFIADVWQVGVRVKIDDKGIVTKENIEMCVREVMEGDKGNEIRENSGKWKKQAKEAIDEGGSSEKNIEEFVAKLMSKSTVTKV